MKIDHWPSLATWQRESEQFEYSEPLNRNNNKKSNNFKRDQ